MGWCCVCSKIFPLNLFSEQFHETAIKSILEAVVPLLEIDVPESKAKVLMLIAEIAKSGNRGRFIIMFNELVKQIRHHSN